MAMKESTYRSIIDTAKATEPLRNAVIWSNRIITVTVYLGYPVLLITLFLSAKNAGLLQEQLPFSRGFLPALLIPGISFVILSIIRDRINAPRPYEVFGIAPVIDKKTVGHSFPSRHIFSIFIIATTFFVYFPMVGVLVGILGTILAVNRVIGGVHFVRDVIVGALSGIFCGTVGFYVLLPLIAS